MFIEKLIIQHCSPTLASIKTGNLFSVTFESLENLQRDVLAYQEILINSGVEIRLLNVNNNKALCYVYRKSALLKELNNPEIIAFLKTYGYEDLTLDLVLDKLDDRIKLNGDFPHEIGVFLGYPLADVIAFIENKGKNYNCCGYWKVYTNTKESLQKFALFDKCRNVYSKMWQSGRSLSQLTIVA